MSYDLNNLEQVLAAQRFQDDVRELFLDAVKVVPYVGRLTSDLVGFLWPSTQHNRWEEIFGAVITGLTDWVDQQLTEIVVNDANQQLLGLQAVLLDYTTSINNGASKQILQEKYISAVTTFEFTLPSFQLPNYQVALLPSYTQLVNLYIGLLRDGAFAGDQLGLDAPTIKQYQIQLLTVAHEGASWVTDQVNIGGIDVRNQAQIEYQHYTPVRDQPTKASMVWAYCNQYYSYMAFACVDPAATWGTLAAFVQPDSLPYSTREIYLIAGDLYQNPPPGLVSAADKPMIDNIRLWGWEDMDAVQQSYNGVWGDRLGDQPTSTAHNNYGGVDTPPHGYNGAVFSDDQITTVTAAAEGWVNYAFLTFQAANNTNRVGGNHDLGWQQQTLQFDNHIVSQIWCEGKTHDYWSTNVMIVGFRYAGSYD